MVTSSKSRSRAEIYGSLCLALFNLYDTSCSGQHFAQQYSLSLPNLKIFCSYKYSCIIVIICVACEGLQHKGIILLDICLCVF